MKKYILNTKTGVLHYKGLCPCTDSIDKDRDNYKCFASENDAKAKCAISVRWCKRCAKNRDK